MNTPYTPKHLLTTFVVLLILGFPGHGIVAVESRLVIDRVVDLGVETTQAFVQDREGFLWFGTAGGGLFRYDGYDLKNYGIGPELLRNGHVVKILEDRSRPDTLWIITVTDGFSRFDTAMETFTHYGARSGGLAASSVADIVQDSRNPDLLWIVADQLLQKFNAATGTFSPNILAPDNQDLPEYQEFFSILEDRANPDILWLAGFGLAKFNKVTQQFTMYLHNPEDTNSLGFESNYIGAITQDKDDPSFLWLGYWDGAGLDRFNTRTETFTHYVHEPDNPESLRDGAVLLVYDDGDGALWLGGWAETNGVTTFEKETGHFMTYVHHPSDPRSISSNTVVQVAKDRSGIVWIVNMTGKIDKYDPYARNFQLYQRQPGTDNTLVDNAVYSLYEDRAGYIWLGTGGGLSKLTPSTGEFTNYRSDPTDPESLDSDYILATYQDSSGVFWVGAYGSPLMRINPDTGKVLERIPLAEGGSVAEIVEDPDDANILWIGGVYSGFARFEKSSRTIHYYAYDPEHPDRGIATTDITEMLHDNREPALWLGSWGGGGLYRFDKTTETFTVYLANPDDPQSLTHAEIGSLYQDREGVLWIGTRGGGLNRFDSSNGIWEHYGKAQGVPSIVNSVLSDQWNKLWLSTHEGIVRFNPKTKTVERHYTRQDGLQGNAFLYESGLKTRDGDLWFGGTNGVNRFHPAKLVKNQHVPPIVLTALTQGGQPIQGQGDRIPGRLDSITLDWRSNFFEFEYAALNYTIPGKNQYKYMLEGLDQEWYSAGTKRTGRYSGLPAGTFTLRIIGSNNDGVWNKEGVALQVTVVPPFWRTLWFRVGAVVIIVGGAVVILLLRLRASEKQRQKLEILVRQRTEELYQAKKRAEEAMYETERRFRVIFNQSFQFMGLANPDGTIREFNQTSLEFFQAEEAHVTGHHLWEAPWFDLPEEQKKIREAVLKAAEGEFVRFETSALAPDGTRVVLDFSMKPMWGEFNNIYLLILEGRDLTDYRRTEEALRETLVAKERMESELQIAHDIQMEIIPRTFPPFPDRKELDIYAILEPAKEVGGDLYDFFFIDHTHFCFVVGDVSDKGVPAALFMSAAKTLIKAIATRTSLVSDGQDIIIPRVDALLTAVNYELSIDNDSCMFVTAFCGILNTETGEVCYTNAGHNAPLLRRLNGETVFLSEHRSTLIGADEDATFTQAMLSMHPGDSLLLYTDGVTEAVNVNKEMFEEERLQAEVSGYAGNSAEEMVGTILESVLSFSKDMPQADDITIMALTYCQSSEKETS